MSSTMRLHLQSRPVNQSRRIRLIVVAAPYMICSAVALLLAPVPGPISGGAAVLVVLMLSCLLFGMLRDPTGMALGPNERGKISLDAAVFCYEGSRPALGGQRSLVVPTSSIVRMDRIGGSLRLIGLNEIQAPGIADKANARGGGIRHWWVRDLPRAEAPDVQVFVARANAFLRRHGALVGQCVTGSCGGDDDGEIPGRPWWFGGAEFSQEHVGMTEDATAVFLARRRGSLLD